MRTTATRTAVRSLVLTLGLGLVIMPAPAPQATTPSPGSWFAVQDIALDQPLETAVQAYGEPSSSAADIFGTAHTWVVSDNSRLVVSAWDDGDREINGIFAENRSGDLEVGGGVVLGRSTLLEAIEAWGPDFIPAAHEGSDYVVAYDRCAGEVPVVVKFDQADAGGTGFVPALLTRPVTSALIAYADADPAATACLSGTS